MTAITTNARVDNVEIVGDGLTTWTITGTAAACRFDDTAGSVTINGDVDTLVDNLMVHAGAATNLIVSGSEQTVFVKIHSVDNDACLISGSDNTVYLAMLNVREDGVTVSGNRNRVDFNAQLNQSSDDTYDACVVSGDKNRVDGNAQIEASNTPRYGVNVSGDSNWLCVFCPDASTGETNNTGANNRFCGYAS